MTLALVLAFWTVVSLLVAALFGAISARLQKRGRELDERAAQEQLRGERQIFVVRSGRSISGGRS
jgi:hypothetical protein